MAVNGTAVAISVAGGVLLYSAVKGKGIGVTVHSLLAGQPVPTDQTNYVGNTNLGTAINNGLGNLVLSGTTTSSYSGNVSAISNWLKHVGFTRAQRCGIMANMQAESGFNPASVGDGGSSLGLCQWHSGRMAALKAFADAKGKPATDLVTQLEYMMAEFSSAYALTQAALRMSTDPATAAVVMCETYEKPADLKGQDAIRANYARDLYQSPVTA